jgi:hypothetical protein
MMPIVRWGSNTHTVSIPEEKPASVAAPPDIPMHDFVTFELRGLGARSGKFNLEFEPDKNLSYYLDKLEIKHLIYKYRILDLAHPENGRRRMSYIPQPDSQIVIMPGGTSTAIQYQRTSVDAQELARNMGKGAFAVEVNINMKKEHG